jgi:arabinogalactan oligomer/maltooligosaccharide transport system permease protein
MKRILVHVLVVLVTAGTLYPVALVVKKSVEPGQEFALSASPVPASFTADHYRDVLGHAGFARHAWNSALIATATTVVGVLLSVTAAYALSRFRFPGRNASLAAFLLVQMFPSTLLMIPLYLILDRLGLLNSTLGLVLVYATSSIPFCVFTLRGWFDTLPKELEEAARIDGASAWQVFYKVVLPLARPAIAVTGLFAFMTAWNEFILAGTFLTDERAYTLPVLLHDYVGEYHAEWGHFAAGAILTSLPVMALFYGLSRYLVGGLTAGAVKG